MIFESVNGADWKKIKEDVEQFLENPSDLNVLTKENILRLISSN